MSPEQRQTVARLLAKGWRGNEGDMFALAVPMFFDGDRQPGERRPSIHVRRDGSVHCGYPRSKR